MTDTHIYFCPSDPQGDPDDYIKCPGGLYCVGNSLEPRCFEDHSYIYHGWAYENDNVYVTGYAWLVGFNSDSYPGSIDVADGDFGIGDDMPSVQGLIDAAGPSLGLPSGIIIAQGNGGGGTIFRLREGIERFMISDINNPAGSALAQSTLPIMFDQMRVKSDGSVTDFFHVPGGANVLYLDGHATFLRYPSQFPVDQIGSLLGRAID